jgi:hypothetical protein
MGTKSMWPKICPRWIRSFGITTFGLSFPTPDRSLIPTRQLQEPSPCVALFPRRRIGDPRHRHSGCHSGSGTLAWRMGHNDAEWRGGRLCEHGGRIASTAHPIQVRAQGEELLADPGRACITQRLACNSPGWKRRRLCSANFGSVASALRWPP